MALRYLLDTNIASAPVAKTPNATVVRRLERHGSTCAISAPAWHELTYGCRRLPAGKRRVALEAYLEDGIRQSFPILAYDEAAARWHGQERARLERLGQPAPWVDGQIAAIAHVHGLVLVTANTKDFVRFKGVRVVATVALSVRLANEPYRFRRRAVPREDGVHGETEKAFPRSPRAGQAEGDDGGRVAGGPPTSGV